MSLDNPLRQRQDDEPVLRPIVPEQPDGDSGAAWQLCGIGIKDQP